MSVQLIFNRRSRSFQSHGPHPVSFSRLIHLTAICTGTLATLSIVSPASDAAIAERREPVKTLRPLRRRRWRS